MAAVSGVGAKAALGTAACLKVVDRGGVEYACCLRFTCSPEAVLRRVITYGAFTRIGR